MSANNASSRLDFILALTDKVSAPLAKVTNSFSELAEKSETNIKQIGTGVAGLWGSLTGIEASLEPALQVNRALGDVRSLGVAEDALGALNAKALEFSVAYGESAESFVASAYKIEGAIKGLAGEQLATFTNTSSVLAKATKTDQDVMSEYVGTLYNLQKQQADAMGKSQWVEKLGGQTALAVQLFRTSGEQMKEGFKEAGAIATASGIDLAEQMAVIGSLSSTMEGGDAGGRYKAFFENIGNASEKLGIKFTDTNGKVMPMLDILAKLQGKFGDLRNAAANAKLVEAFGGEGAQVIGALAQDTGRLKNGIDQLGKVRGLEQAEKMAQAMVDPWQQFGQAVQALRIAFGQALIPMLQPLMTRLVDIGKTLTRWTQLFPNITRVVGIATLAVLAITAALSALTVVVGLSRMAMVGLNVVWTLLTWTGWRCIAMFVAHSIQCVLMVARVLGMVAVLGLAKGAMLLWQGAIWLVNAAMYANPIGAVVAGIVALVAVVAVVIVYWDDLKAALMDTAAFQWVASHLQMLSDWFNSMGGWSGLAQAAWDNIVGIFQRSIGAVIEMLNKIPGVNIEASFGELPATPDLPQIPGQVVPVGMGAVAAQSALVPAGPAIAVPPTMGAVDLVDQSRQGLASVVPSVSPSGPSSVPPGGLLNQIKNTSQSQDRRVQVGKVEIHTSKPMTPLELENMVGMAVG
ncbi:phage tail tape measure protein [Pseudomonas guariconensis]|uniref:Phage tail tape measure protein n=1 Tax=Pseudomonas guariconensis TaxID=1288410 RepID=A0AAX0W2N8_9PSED|nr:phage tail tape measure protein [Pseudomonas guariconensis]MCO7620791.1 phage tail tape measure protein [Pseudomonas guariconensis]PLV21145.1 phage tail tape measure protein [Pseudomonas guariconensis]PLV26022.1 phage tail tape measure protein [Pseudomonas guariconensis]PLV31098.1 phage tail tape measure protein [Pseudomonas guariconensis]